MIQLIDAVPPRAYDWAGYGLTQHAQHAADVHTDRLTTYGSYDVHDNELTGWVHLLDEADAVRIDTLAVRPASRHQGIAGALLDAAVRHAVNQNVAVVRCHAVNPLMWTKLTNRGFTSVDHSEYTLFLVDRRPRRQPAN